MDLIKKEPWLTVNAKCKLVKWSFQSFLFSFSFYRKWIFFMPYILITVSPPSVPLHFLFLSDLYPVVDWTFTFLYPLFYGLLYSWVVGPYSPPPLLLLLLNLFLPRFLLLIFSLPARPHLFFLLLFYWPFSSLLGFVGRKGNTDSQS